MSANNSSTEYSNPVLYNFIGYQLQPYWLFIVQLLVIQILMRLYSLIESSCKKKKKHIYIAIELSILGQERTGEFFFISWEKNAQSIYTAVPLV